MRRKPVEPFREHMFMSHQAFIRIGAALVALLLGGEAIASYARADEALPGPPGIVGIEPAVVPAIDAPQRLVVNGLNLQGNLVAIFRERTHSTDYSQAPDQQYVQRPGLLDGGRHALVTPDFGAHDGFWTLQLSNDRGEKSSEVGFFVRASAAKPAPTGEAADSNADGAVPGPFTRTAPESAMVAEARVVSELPEAPVEGTAAGSSQAARPSMDAPPAAAIGADDTTPADSSLAVASDKGVTAPVEGADTSVISPASPPKGSDAERPGNEPGTPLRAPYQVAEADVGTATDAPGPAPGATPGMASGARTPAPAAASPLASTYGSSPFGGSLVAPPPQRTMGQIGAAAERAASTTPHMQPRAQPAAAPAPRPAVAPAARPAAAGPAQGMGVQVMGAGAENVVPSAASAVQGGDGSMDQVVRPEVTTAVVVSDRDINRIACDEDVTDVIWSEERPVKISKDGGSVFVKFLVEKMGDHFTKATEPVDLHIVCGDAVYTLVLHPQGTDSVTIRLRAPPSKSIHRIAKEWGALALEEKVQKLTLMVYKADLPEGFQRKRIREDDVRRHLTLYTRGADGAVIPVVGVHVTGVYEVVGDGTGLRATEYEVVCDRSRELRETDFLGPVFGQEVGVTVDPLKVSAGEPARLIVISESVENGS